MTIAYMQYILSILISTSIERYLTKWQSYHNSLFFYFKHTQLLCFGCHFIIYHTKFQTFSKITIVKSITKVRNQQGFHFFETQFAVKASSTETTYMLNWFHLWVMVSFFFLGQSLVKRKENKYKINWIHKRKLLNQMTTSKAQPQQTNW